MMSSLNIRALLSFLDKGKLKLCQQFVCYNPARLPSPVQWVNVERTRLKDSFTYVWWMSQSDRPKADNRRILKPYSQSMKQLLSSQKYNPGKRPSGHNIGKISFLKDNEGAISPSPPLDYSTLDTKIFLGLQFSCSAVDIFLVLVSPIAVWILCG